MGKNIEAVCGRVNWEEHLELGIPLIDSQHRTLVRITDNLHFVCTNGKKTNHYRFIQAVRELLDYAHYHFSTEEKIMALLEFPERHDHAKEHEDFFQEILNRSKDFDDEKNFVPCQFVQFLQEWIFYHIEVSDRVFTDFFQNMKQHDKLKVALAR